MRGGATQAMRDIVEERQRAHGPPPPQSAYRNKIEGALASPHSTPSPVRAPVLHDRPNQLEIDSDGAGAQREHWAASAVRKASTGCPA